MADGSTKAIENIAVGDTATTTDAENGETTTRQVTHTWVHPDDLYKIVINDQALITTEDHPFYNITDHQWQRADQLDPGDYLLTPNGASATVSSIGPIPVGRDMAHNLTIDDIHTYYVMVGSTPVLVHNSSCDIPKPRTGNGLTPPNNRDPVRRFPRNEVKAKLDDQGNVCAMCDEPLDLKGANGHHIERHADGGPTTPDNLVVLCPECHHNITENRG